MAVTDRRGLLIDTSLAIKAPVRVATTGANIVLLGLQTIGGVALAEGDRVLVKNQTDPTTNGIYNASANAWTRAIDADDNSQLASGTQVLAASGSQADVTFVLTTPNPIVLGTSALTFAAAPNAATALAASVITVNTESAYPQSRKLAVQPNVGLTLTDNGPGGTLMVGLQGGIVFKKNYLKNAGMRVAQRYGSNGPIVDGTANQNIAAIDRWRVAANGAGKIAAGQVATRTPGGSPNRFQLVVTTQDASPAAGSWYYIEQKIANWDSTEWGFSTPTFAPNLTCRLGVNAPAGTYAVSLINNDDSYSFTTTFTIAPGEARTDVYKTVNFPGTTGIGSFDSGGINGPIGAVLLIDLGSGSNVTGTGGAWVNTLKHNEPGQFNWIGTTSNVFQLFDTQLEIGASPGPFQLQDYELDLKDAYTFLQPIGKESNNLYGFAVAQSATLADMLIPISPPMPGIEMAGGSTNLNTTGAGTDYAIGNYAGAGAVNCSAAPGLIGVKKDKVLVRFTASGATMTGGQLQRVQANGSSVWLFVDNQI